ncbi:MAG: DUF4384 domain-containing protein [Candidatus Glassbacteria bacterium]
MKTLVSILIAVTLSYSDGMALYPEDLKIDVWLDRGDGAVYNMGDPVTVYFKTNADCFVTVYNIDTEGYINILFPSYPGEGNFIEGNKTYFVPANTHDDFFIIDEPTGQGYIEAVASSKPFYLEGWPFYTQKGAEGHYAGEAIERITGDPFLAIEEINNKILPFGEDTEYVDDFSVYYVEEVVSYPRYVCNDCHVPTYYHYDPYYYPCTYVDIVIFDYWWYNRWFYCDYWWVDYYYFYDYYYYAPPPAYLGRRYTRKYGYTTKENRRYTTKGYQDKGGTVRVNDYYRGKDVFRGDFKKAIDVKSNPVVNYKLPQMRDEAGYVSSSVKKHAPATESGGEGAILGRKSPSGVAGSDYRQLRDVQKKSPAREEGETGIQQRRRATGKSPRADRSQSRSGGSEIRKSARPPGDEAYSRPGRGKSVTRKAPAQDRGRGRVESREEYRLRGWDRKSAGSSKRSSGISIIKSRPRQSSAPGSVSRHRPASRAASKPHGRSSISRGSGPRVRRK